MILLALVFSKNFYTASLSSFYAFYLIERFDLTIQQSQLYLFVFLGSVAAGTFLGGPVGDRLRAMGRDRGYELLGFLDSGFRNFSNNRGPIRVPDNMRGL